LTKTSQYLLTKVLKQAGQYQRIFLREFTQDSIEDCFEAGKSNFGSKWTSIQLH